MSITRRQWDEHLSVWFERYARSRWAATDVPGPDTAAEVCCLIMKVHARPRRRQHGAPLVPSRAPVAEFWR